MDIYLIRHTNTAADPGLCYGHSDVGLADSFADEAQDLHDKLPEFDADCKVFSSPLTRCLELAKTFSTTVTTDARLKELHFGDWEGLRFDDIDAGAVQRWTDDFVKAAPPNGENFEDLYLRAGSFWQDLSTVKAEQVLVITHAGVIRALLARALNLPLANSFQLRIDAGSVHKLRHSVDYIYVDYINL
ncbi:alpha-ribazole phosphatase [Methylobacter sp.]|uniref:alpha-ribazole phosphatase n=1 Tax=Methylobacter sp. TaxID=2051955 RepID=UPI003DA640FF